MKYVLFILVFGNGDGALPTQIDSSTWSSKVACERAANIVAPVVAVPGTTQVVKTLCVADK